MWRCVITDIFGFLLYRPEVFGDPVSGLLVYCNVLHWFFLQFNSSPTLRDISLCVRGRYRSSRVSCVSLPHGRQATVFVWSVAANAAIWSHVEYVGKHRSVVRTWPRRTGQLGLRINVVSREDWWWYRWLGANCGNFSALAMGLSQSWAKPTGYQSCVKPSISDLQNYPIWKDKYKYKYVYGDTWLRGNKGIWWFELIFHLDMSTLNSCKL